MKSAHAFKYQYYANKNELASKRDLLSQLPPHDTERHRLHNRIQLLRRCNQMYNQQYQRLTGKPIENIINLPEVVIRVPTSGLNIASSLEIQYAKLDNSLWHLKADLDSLQQQVDSFAGGFINIFTATYWMEPKLIKLSYARPAEKLLDDVKSALKYKDHDLAAALLVRARNTIEFGLTRLVNFRRKMNISGQRAIIAINLIKEASITVVTGKANLGVRGSGIMGAYEKTIEEVTTLGARTAWGDEKIDYSDEAKKIVTNAVAAGIGNAAGKYVGNLDGLAVKMGKKQFSKQFAIQLSKKVGVEVLEGQVSKAMENTVQLMAKATRGSLTKKDVADMFADQVYQATKIGSLPGANQVSTMAEKDVKSLIVNELMK